MGHPDYRRCRGCGRHASEVGPLSWTRQCEACGKARLLENIDGIHTKTGPAFLRWRIGMAATVLPPEITVALIEAGAFGVLDAGDDAA